MLILTERGYIPVQAMTDRVNIETLPLVPPAPERIDEDGEPYISLCAKPDRNHW